MDRAEVFVCAGILEGERKLLVGIKGPRFEQLVIVAHNGVRHVVLVDPCNFRARLYFELHGRETEVIDGHRGRAGFFLSCDDGARPQSATRERKRKNSRRSENRGSENPWSPALLRFRASHVTSPYP